MSVARVTLTNDPKIWNVGYEVWMKKVEHAMLSDIEGRQPEIEQWMKTNAPWVDNTGRARASLYTDLHNNVGELELTMRYTNSIDYARYLEYDHAGKFSILMPTQDFWSLVLLSDMQEILNG